MMTTTDMIPTQFITNAQGQPVAVILPVALYERIKPLLDADFAIIREDDTKQQTDEAKLQLMEQAVIDPLFLADLEETMQHFVHVDAEWVGEG